MVSACLEQVGSLSLAETSRHTYQPKQNPNVVKGENRKAEREKGVLAEPLRETPFYTAIGLFSGFNAKLYKHLFGFLS